MEKEREKEITAGFTDGYVGTYYSEESRGIYRFSFHEETGELTAP